MRAHFSEKFAVPFNEDSDRWPWQVPGISSEPLITLEELQRAANRAKPSKATGQTGISNELLKAIMQTEEGQTLLLAMFRQIHASPTVVSAEFFEGLVVLIEKTACVTLPRDVRPIVLTECVCKWIAAICIRRTLDVWPTPLEVMGGIAGIQLAEVVKVAQVMAVQSAMYDDGFVYLRLDITGAFDSADIPSMLEYLARHAQSTQMTSCASLHYMMTRQTLRFFLGWGVEGDHEERNCARWRAFSAHFRGVDGHDVR